MSSTNGKIAKNEKKSKLKPETVQKEDEKVVKSIANKTKKQLTKGKEFIRQLQSNSFIDITLNSNKTVG